MMFLYSSCVDTAVERYGLHKMALLRAFCKKLGVQLLLREYNFDSKTKQAVHDDDVIDMFPVVKCIHPRVRHFDLLCIVPTRIARRLSTF